MRERITEADERIMHWVSHTNAGVITGLIVCFAFILLVTALLG